MRVTLLTVKLIRKTLHEWESLPAEIIFPDGGFFAGRVWKAAGGEYYQVEIPGDVFLFHLEEVSSIIEYDSHLAIYLKEE
jgi:hypothetical protein